MTNVTDLLADPFFKQINDEVGPLQRKIDEGLQLLQAKYPDMRFFVNAAYTVSFYHEGSLDEVDP